MAAGDVKEAYSAEVELLASGNIADGASSEFVYDNSSNKYRWAILVVNISAGAGADADGVVLYERQSTDGGTSYSDVAGAPLITLPSPNSAAKLRHVRMNGPLGPRPGWSLKNDSGAQITAEVTAIFGYDTVATS